MTSEQKKDISEMNELSGETLEIQESSPDGKVECEETFNASETSEEVKMEWYVLKVQSNREDSVKRNLERRAKIANLDKYFGQIVVPTESQVEIKGGRRKTTKHKLYPGYVIVQMEINEDTWYLVRQTSGIGDFAGAAGKPIPMLPGEVEKILAVSDVPAEEPSIKIGFKVGDKIKVSEGNFESYEGEVYSIDSVNGRVTVMINIFGRSTPVELEYWQIETL